MSGAVVPAVDTDDMPVLDILNRARVLGRPHRGGSYVHVSDLLSKCLRKTALLESVGMQTNSAGLSLTDSLTFAQGDAIHDVLKDRAASGAPNRVWGNWKCRCGTTATTTPLTRSELDASLRCTACKGAVDQYVEVPMRNEQYKIVGTPDLLILMTGQKALYITELKSISHEAWKDLVRPDPDHVMQVLLYWFLMNALGYSLCAQVSIVYATKGWLFGKSPCKEFVFDAQEQQSRVQPFLDEALALKAHREGGALPIRVCSSPTCSVAKKCELSKTCFAATDEKPITISIASALNSGAKANPPAPTVRRRSPSHRD